MPEPSLACEVDAVIARRRSGVSSPAESGDPFKIRIPAKLGFQDRKFATTRFG